jgi:hypothetical protein
MIKSLHLTFSKWTFDEGALLGKPGGFGQVHPGTSPDGRPIAVKVMRPDIGGAAHRELEFAQAFAGRVTDHIVAILDYGEDLNLAQTAIVMARADGNIREHLRTETRFPEDRVADTIIQIARGLIEAGDWIHRDLKPENVLWFGGRWQITDFGIARLAEVPTASDTLKGCLSPPYAAPEQWDHQRATHATDIYALGCVGVEVLTGQPPFSGPTHDDFAHQHRAVLPIVNRGSPRLRSILVRMLAKPAVARPAAEQVIEELTSFRARPAGTGIGGLRLTQVSAVVAEETARRQALALAAKAEEKERQQLAEQAIATLHGLAEELFAQVKEHAPQSVIQNRGIPDHPAYEALLGDGQLAMSVGHFSYVPAEVFQGSMWDVVCGDYIVVQNFRGNYTRSASLWYANLGDGRYRWIEVAYWSIKADLNRQPCYLAPTNLAVGAAMQRGDPDWSFAYKPRPIDGEYVDQFHQRWMSFFAEAAAGTLNQPNVLPEGR